MPFIAVFACGLLCFQACGLKTDSQIDSKAVNQEIKDRKLKRVPDAQIVQAAFEHGQEAAAFFIEQQVVTDSMCGNLPLAGLDSLLGVLVVSADVACAQSGSWGLKEKQVWEAYQNSHAAGQALEGNIQKLEGDSLMYAMPLAGAKGLSLLRVFISKKETIRSFQ